MAGNHKVANVRQRMQVRLYTGIEHRFVDGETKYRDIGFMNGLTV